MKTKPIILIILVTALFGGVAVFLRADQFRAATIDRVGGQVLAGVADVQQAHMLEKAEFLSDPEALRKVHTLKGLTDYELFLSPDELPAEYRAFLPPSAWPELSKHSYRMLLAVKNRYSKAVNFWLAEKGPEPKRLSKSLPLPAN